MLMSNRLNFVMTGCLAGFFFILPSVVTQANDALTVLPAEVTLTGPQARQRLLVEEMRNGHAAGQVIEGVTFESSDLKVVRVEDGRALPAGNGTAVVTAHVGDHTAKARITVERFDQPHQWSFRNHVQSVLSKAGCNSGACHGAAAGKNGFRLSLRGYDPDFDYHSITRQANGRRIVASDPGRSLFLLKPTATVPHKGGLRFEVGSREYQVLSEWLAAGHPGPREDDPRMTRLEILPQHVVLKQGSPQQILVRAHFSDGHSEDVTRWAKYTATNLSVAQVDDSGRVEVMGQGEGAVVAWYLSNNVVASISVPYDTHVPADVYAKSPRKNFIDELVLEKLESLNLPPSPLSSDEVFLRRAFLDTIGVLPTIDETTEFLSDTAPDKRETLVDRLLSREEFVDYWTYKWCDLLLVNGERLRPKALTAYYKWIRQQVAQNTPWNRFVWEVVTAKGSTLENGAANFYSLHEDPLDMSETVSMAFLGMSIQCARCHDHPLEKWTNNDYYGMANLFSRVRGKGWGGDSRNGDGNRVVFTVNEGELIQPRTGKPQPPRPLDGEPLPFDSRVDRRVYLAKWLTSPDNPYFTRAIVNRVWANFLGVGIVEKVDDMRLTNPPSNEKLLAALAEYLVKNHYDLKKLMRLILTSETYQRSSRTVPGNEGDERFYSRYYPKRLEAEVLLDAVSQVTGVPTQFKGYPDGTRALELPDVNVESYFLSAFGRPERLITCECERSNEPSMVQVLHLMNGETINQKVAAEKNRVGQLLSANTPDEGIADEAYLSALCRYPTDKEREQILQILKTAETENRRAVVEDLYWSILTSKEFLFNH